MRRRWLLVGAILALAAGCGGDERGAPPPAQSKPQPQVSQEEILGFLWSEAGGRGELTRLHERTLEPHGPRVELGPGGGSTTAFSPDYGTLAIGSGEDATVQLVDLGRMRSLGVVDLELRGWVTLLSWERGYLFAVVNGQGERAVVTIDPVGRSVQATRSRPSSSTR